MRMNNDGKMDSEDTTVVSRGNGKGSNARHPEKFAVFSTIHTKNHTQCRAINHMRPAWAATMSPTRSAEGRRRRVSASILQISLMLRLVADSSICRFDLYSH